MKFLKTKSDQDIYDEVKRYKIDNCMKIYHINFLNYKYHCLHAENRFLIGQFGLRNGLTLEGITF